MNKLLSKNFSLIFHSHKIHLLALLELLPTEMTDFPTLSYTWSLKTGTPFGQSLPIQAIFGYLPPPPLPRACIFRSAEWNNNACSEKYKWSMIKVYRKSEWAVFLASFRVKYQPKMFQWPPFSFSGNVIRPGSYMLAERCMCHFQIWKFSCKTEICSAVESCE